MASFAPRARGGYFRHISWVVGMIPIPESISRLITLRMKPSEECATFSNLVELSKKVHEKAKKDDIHPEWLEELDKLVAEAYGLTEDELKTVRDYFDFTYTGSETFHYYHFSRVK